MWGCELLRIDAADGEPFPRTWLPQLPKGGLNLELERPQEELFRIKGRSRWGDSLNMSSSDTATPDEALVWNLNGGPWLSGAGFVIPN